MTDYAVIRSDETLGVYDNLADAVRIWKPLRKSGARIISMSPNGYVYSAIVGDLTVRKKGKLSGRSKMIKSVPVGWNRIEPPYRGKNWFRLSASESASLAPGYVAVSWRTEVVRRKAEERKRERKKLFRD